MKAKAQKKAAVAEKVRKHQQKVEAKAAASWKVGSDTRGDARREKAEESALLRAASTEAKRALERAEAEEHSKIKFKGRKPKKGKDKPKSADLMFGEDLGMGRKKKKKKNKKATTATMKRGGGGVGGGALKATWASGIDAALDADVGENNTATGSTSEGGVHLTSQLANLSLRHAASSSSSASGNVGMAAQQLHEATTTVDAHPERRMKAAFNAYKEREMPLVSLIKMKKKKRKKGNPSIRWGLGRHGSSEKGYRAYIT